MRGPIDYIIVGFEGDKFDGSVLRAVSEAIDSRVINLVALVFVKKDSDGQVTVFDLVDIDDAYMIEFNEKYKTNDSLISQDDVDEITELVEPNVTAGMLIIEQLWAKPLKRALLDANGYMVAEGRIHPDAANELKDIEEA